MGAGDQAVYPPWCDDRVAIEQDGELGSASLQTLVGGSRVALRLLIVDQGAGRLGVLLRELDQVSIVLSGTAIGNECEAVGRGSI